MREYVLVIGPALSQVGFHLVSVTKVRVIKIGSFGRSV